MFAAVCAKAIVATNVLADVARDFSPRVEVSGSREVTLDVSGLTRLFGDARTIAMELRRTAAERGLPVCVAIAQTRTAARLLAHAASRMANPDPSCRIPDTSDVRSVHDREVTIVEPGAEADSVAELPIELLDIFADDESQTADSSLQMSNLRTPNLRISNPRTANVRTSNVRRWGLRSLGELAALPADAVAARLGQQGIEWQRLARGEDRGPLVPAVPEERFEQALDLEWPIDGLEPLSFVLGRLMDPLSLHLERRDRGVAVLHVRLHLVTREVYERSLQLPVPIRDARTLRMLALLDLESHPPSAAIDRVVVAVDPTPGRVIQFSLLTRPLPSPEQLSTLMARLAALMGESRCGAAVVVDTWAPGAFAMKPFAPRESANRDQLSNHLIPDPRSLIPVTALRRFRFPVAARVRVEHGVPTRIVIDRRELSGGQVHTCAGPWRTSGGWWIEQGAGSAGRAGQAGRAGKAGGAGQAGKAGRADGGGADLSPVPPYPPFPPSWDRDEWDVTLADRVTYRIFRERDTDGWFVEGVID